YICTEDIEQADSYLRFSLVLNDLTLLSTGGFRQLQMIWLTRDWFEKALELQSATIEVSGSKLRELNIDPEDPQFAVGFVFP
ncbi:MAG TPA: hypothetical protein VG963_30985, partial [Polyangiaceae bacterium]|nr:hypothetical protein [Polyangiaceae bacterium]